MPKYLIEASYTAEGLRGLQKDKASGRKQAVTKLVLTAEETDRALSKKLSYRGPGA